MKRHRFFAWAAAVCFLLTLITGYRRKKRLRPEKAENQVRIIKEGVGRWVER